jgi:hypothetical protein
LLIGCRTSPATPDAHWCQADCECGTEKCLANVCVGGHQIPMSGYCGRGITTHPVGCDCVGGTCDSRGCCVLPDGGIDNGYGLACWPRDAGVDAH